MKMLIWYDSRILRRTLTKAWAERRPNSDLWVEYSWPDFAFHCPPFLFLLPNILGSFAFARASPDIINTFLLNFLWWTYSKKEEKNAFDGTEAPAAKLGIALSSETSFTCDQEAIQNVPLYYPIFLLLFLFYFLFKILN